MIKKKILIYTCMWKRYSVSKLFAMGITRFINDAPDWAEVKVLAAVSDEISEMLCSEFGFYSVMCDNRPLGRKWNSGLEAALKQFDFDYLMIMGDDDLIASDVWKYYEMAMFPPPFMAANGPPVEFIEEKTPLDYFGFNEIYFLNAEKKIASRFSYKGKGASNKLIGCGRMISKKAIAMSGWQSEITMNENIGRGILAKTQRQWVSTYQADYFVGMKNAKQEGNNRFALWDEIQDRGLDNTSEIRLLTNGFPPTVLITNKPMLTDVKTETNLWAYEKYGPLGLAVSFEESTWFMSNQEKDFLRKTFSADSHPLGAEKIPRPV